MVAVAVEAGHGGGRRGAAPTADAGRGLQPAKLGPVHLPSSPQC